MEQKVGAGAELVEYAEDGAMEVEPKELEAEDVLKEEAEVEAMSEEEAKAVAESEHEYEAAEAGAETGPESSLVSLVRSLEEMADKLKVSKDDVQAQLEEFLALGSTNSLNVAWESKQKIVLGLMQGAELLGAIVGCFVGGDSRHAYVEIHGVRVAQRTRGRKHGSHLLLEFQLLALNMANGSPLSINIPPTGHCHRNIDACLLYLSCGWHISYKPRGHRTYAPATKDVLEREKDRLQQLLTEGAVDVIQIQPLHLSEDQQPQYCAEWLKKLADLVQVPLLPPHHHTTSTTPSLLMPIALVPRVTHHTHSRSSPFIVYLCRSSST